MSDDVTRARLLAQAEAAIQRTWGYGLADVSQTGVAVVPARHAEALLAVRVGDGALLLAEPSWQRSCEELAASLSVEQLFSIYGTFELARTTLPDGVSPFGPVWVFLADRQSLKPARNAAVEELKPDDLRRLSPDTYWHCSVDTAARGFALRGEGRITALAAVWQTPESLWEIGVDVLPAGQGRGAGRAVVSAAAEWILARAPLVYYTTGAFNVPSCRTAMALGFRHVWSFIRRLRGPFLVPPSPIGRPLPGVVPQPYWREYPE
jgi:GNAT superfamily N-acetyltransferase